MSSVESVGRGVLALAAVLFVLWLLTRAVGRRQKRTGHVVDVVGRTQLSRHASIAVVRIGERDVVVGITDSGVNLLGDVDGLRTPRLVGGDVPPVGAVPVELSPRLQRAAAGDAPARHEAGSSGPLAGSALSPATWKQSVEALRTLTVRSRAR